MIIEACMFLLYERIFFLAVRCGNVALYQMPGLVSHLALVVSIYTNSPGFFGCRWNGGTGG